MLRSRKGECDVVVIDYLHTLAPLTKRGETQESVIRHTITVLKRIAVEANCAMLVFSQFNREAVSYTHLDVYKRQVWLFLISQLVMFIRIYKDY